MNFTFLTFTKFLFSVLFVAILLKSAKLLRFWQFEFDTTPVFDDLNTCQNDSINKIHNVTNKYLTQVFERKNLSSVWMKKV